LKVTVERETGVIEETTICCNDMKSVAVPDYEKKTLAWENTNMRRRDWGKTFR